MMGQDPEARPGPHRITPWDSWDQAQEVAGDDDQGALEARIRVSPEREHQGSGQKDKGETEQKPGERKGLRRLEPAANAANTIQVDTGRTR